MRIMRLAMSLFWLMDIMNLPFMAQFDTTYPLNGLFWVCAFILSAFL